MNSDKPAILERVRAVLERGDHWLARQRLESHLATGGYDAAILTRLGDIALSMHDAFSAGRYYIGSSAAGEHVDAAIATFVTHVRSEPNQVATQLPLVVRRASPDRFPKVAVRRLREAGLEPALEKLRRQAAQPPRHTQASGLVAAILMLLVVLFVICGLVGLWAIGSWILGKTR